MLDARQDIRHGVFVSDLHLFSPRSRGAGIPAQLEAFRRKDQCIVLGGDIFDFRWSDHGGLDSTLAAAGVWLTQLLELTGDSDVVFLPGNHDCHPMFLALLDQTAQANPRFSWCDHHLQLGDCLFLHGDVLDAGNSAEQLANYRLRFHHVDAQSAVLHRAYDLAVALRIHQIVPKLRHSPARTCQRLWDTLGGLPEVDCTPIRRIFFGHTHVPIHGLEWNGIQFFNPGAALKHMNYHMHEFLIE